MPLAAAGPSCPQLCVLSDGRQGWLNGRGRGSEGGGQQGRGQAGGSGGEQVGCAGVPLYSLGVTELSACDRGPSTGRAQFLRVNWGLSQQASSVGGGPGGPRTPGLQPGPRWPAPRKAGLRL